MSATGSWEPSPPIPHHNLTLTILVGPLSWDPPLSLVLRIRTRTRPPDPSTTRTLPLPTLPTTPTLPTHTIPCPSRLLCVVCEVCVCTITSIPCSRPPTQAPFGSVRLHTRLTDIPPPAAPNFLLNFLLSTEPVCHSVTQQHQPHPHPHDPASPLPSRNPRGIANNVSASHWLTRIDTSSQSPTTHSPGYPRIRIPAPLLDAVIPTR